MKMKDFIVVVDVKLMEKLSSVGKQQDTEV